MFLKDPNLMAHAELATAVCEALFVITERTISEKKLSESGVFEGELNIFRYRIAHSFLNFVCRPCITVRLPSTNVAARGCILLV